MANNYKTKVNEQYEFELHDKSLEDLDVVKTSENTYHIIDKNITYHIKIIKNNFEKRKYEILVNNNKYFVELETELDALIKELGLTSGKEIKEKNIKAPMPGVILDIQISEGQKVKEGDSLLILEAMKMENILVAPMDGVVKRIYVNKGDSVEKKTVLIELE